MNFIIGCILCILSFASFAEERYSIFSCEIVQGPTQSLGKKFKIYQESNPEETGIMLIYGIFFQIPGQESLGEFGFSGLIKNEDIYAIPGGHWKTPGGNTFPDGYALLNLKENPENIENEFEAQLLVLSEDGFELSLDCKKEL